MHNEAFYVRLNKLNPRVCKRNGIKFYAWKLFYLNLFNLRYVVFQPGKLCALHKTVFIYLHVKLLKQ